MVASQSHARKAQSAHGRSEGALQWREGCTSMMCCWMSGSLKLCLQAARSASAASCRIRGFPTLTPAWKRTWKQPQRHALVADSSGSSLPNVPNIMHFSCSESCKTRAAAAYVPYPVSAALV